MTNNKIKIVLLAGFLFMCFIQFYSIQSSFALDIPIAVKEQEVVANYRIERRNDGQFRSDSSSPWDYCIESGCYYSPQPGDRINVGFNQGWRLTFWNVGEDGGEEKKIAKLENITEFFTAGDIITEVVPPINEESYKNGITYSKIISEPAPIDNILDPYLNPKFSFKLGFTGGPNGIFYEIDGIKQHPNGKGIRGDIMQGEDGYFYVQMSGAFTTKLDIDDQDIFRGYTVTKGGIKGTYEGNYAMGFSDWSGEVYVEYGDNVAPASDFDNSNKSNKVISAGATIKTGDDSYAIVILDGGTLIMGPNSELKIKKPELGYFDSKLGRVFMNVKKNLKRMSEGQMPEVTMNQAVAGRKGTTAIFIEEDNISTVKVIDGEINFKSIATGESVDVLPGQTVSATPEGLSELTNFNIDQEYLEWEKIVPKSAIDQIKSEIKEENLSSDEPINNSNSDSQKNTWQWLTLLITIIFLGGLGVIFKKGSCPAKLKKF